MKQVTAPEIPEEFCQFASAVADLAVAHGIERFEMSFRPDWEHRKSSEWERVINGEMIIGFTAVDGRGRPSRGLNIRVSANLTVQIENEPTSY